MKFSLCGLSIMWNSLNFSPKWHRLNVMKVKPIQMVRGGNRTMKLRHATRRTLEAFLLGKQYTIQELQSFCCLLKSFSFTVLNSTIHSSLNLTSTPHHCIFIWEAHPLHPQLRAMELSSSSSQTQLKSSSHRLALLHSALQEVVPML